MPSTKQAAASVQTEAWNTSELRPRLAGVPIFVSDQEKALQFYRDKLGYQVIDDQSMGDARWLTVARTKGDPVLILYKPSQWTGMNDHSDLTDRIGSWTGIIFETDNIQQSYKEMLSNGVMFEAEPKKQPWGGWETWFHDPDGNRFHLGQRPPSH